MHRLKSFWGELNRRRVVRVGVVYLIVAWVIVEVASVLFPSLLLPDWTSRLVVALAMLGFPVVLVLAWAFELSPDGVRRETEYEHKDVSAVAPQLSGPNLTADENDQRLDGWKRIAAFLSRDVRTVRRWEKSQGLPVRRVVHEKGATVYAFRAELEAWMAKQDRPEFQATPAQPSGKAGRANRSWLWPALIGISLLAVSAGWWKLNRSPEIQFREWDWVLITEFDNRSREEVLDGTLEYALQRDLGNSSYVKVVPRERIIDALHLMKLPPDTSVDEQIGREISLRDGAIRVLITGRIDKLGDAYTLSASLVNPSDGVIMASFTAVAQDQTIILGKISEISHNVRLVLGEGLDSIRASEQKLARVTTPSLQALKLYSEADLMMSNGAERKDALPLLEQAIRIDPDFASAHLLISYLQRDQDRVEAANQHLERAVELAETTSERERLFILSTYYASYLNDIPKSIETSELLARLYPDHFWATANLASRYTLNNDYARAHPWIIRRAELSPNLGWTQLEALHSSLVFDDPEVQQRYRGRTGTLADQDAWINVNLQILPVQELWLKGDIAGAVEELDMLMSDFQPAELLGNNPLFAQVRSLYLAMGQWNQFREVSALRPEAGWLQAIADLDAGDTSTLNQYLQGVAEGDYWDAVMFILAGQTQAAEEIIADPMAAERLSPFYWPREFIHLARGRLALAKGRYQEAIGHLEATEFLKLRTMTHYYFARLSQAQAQAALGQTEAAIETLESSLRDRDWTIFDAGATYFWMRNQMYLLKLYKQSGLDQEAAVIEATLREMLQLADPGHPIVQRLKEIGESS